MADMADRAQKRIDRELQANIAAARGIVPPNRESANECEECGELIPSARQLAMPGCTMCAECRENREIRARREAGLL